MAKIFLHIGSPKTATTTLQNLFFIRFHEKKSINYIGKRTDLAVTKELSKQDQHYHSIYNKIMNSLLWSEDFDKDLATYIKSINSIIDDYKINVISEEVLFNRDNVRGLIPFFERIQRLQVLLAGHCVEVFCSLRRQAEYLYSRYVQNYASQWHYVRGKDTIEQYYHSIIMHPKEIKLMSHHIDTIRAYRQTFGQVHCFFYEELLQDEFSYYQKIAQLLGIKITTADIPKLKLNTQQKTKGGYITPYRRLPGKMIKKRKVPVILRRLIFANICYFALRAVSRIFLRYNIFLTRVQKHKLYNKLLALESLLLNIFYKPRPHLYFTKEQKLSIFELCKKGNQDLVAQGFCKEQDLKKYGYL